MSGLVSGYVVGHEGDMSLEEEKVCEMVVSGKFVFASLSGIVS